MKNELEKILEDLKKLDTFFLKNGIYGPDMYQIGASDIYQINAYSLWVKKDAVQAVIKKLEDLLNSEEFYDYNNRGEAF